ncbi:hypothetical protein VOLCADRAFT_99420 [Volvox carteri f. nagariensis]|uniref:Uncharacterized protein n=1 Tax=Volvox carteri f. nagariensis TaxID=3068 RepID=D8UHR7_VOLCA|nr:uncharacterized protein VOLCADRAFT_99420 [Volvox carteri f. nagariensis]EFJ40728.1 hypothetical protein VOLCADRAFT_99420 [Volvox carteri f. nagariensis]|eukprot:XP_002958194.1 hypothetical protein VOLCADRAFT_99420 [Volvox carteri f. nagariensis]
MLPHCLHGQHDHTERGCELPVELEVVEEGTTGYIEHTLWLFRWHSTRWYGSCWKALWLQGSRAMPGVLLVHTWVEQFSTRGSTGVGGITRFSTRERVRLSICRGAKASAANEWVPLASGRLCKLANLSYGPVRSTKNLATFVAEVVDSLPGTPAIAAGSSSGDVDVVCCSQLMANYHSVCNTAI